MITRPGPRRLPVARRQRIEGKDVQRMIETKAWFVTHTGRAQGTDIAKDEPSHIHLPRRRRVARPADRGTGEAWADHVSDDEYRRHAQPATGEA